MRIATPEPASSVLHEDVSWEEFERILAEFGDRPALSVTYDRGRLEIVSPSPDHEVTNRLLAQLVETICDARRVHYRCFGSMTVRRSDLLRAVEPDTCYFIQSLARVPVDRPFDFTVDPPPDLVVEVDITRRSIERFPIYAALGVPEVWQFRDDRIRAYALLEGRYEPIEHSLAFPWLRVEELSRFVADRGQRSDLEIRDALRAWVRASADPDR